MKNLKTIKECNSIFAKRLNLLMKENSVNQSQIASYLGISRQAVSKYKLGECDPTMENIQKICIYFNVSSDYMLGLSDIPNTVEEYCFEEIEKIITEINKYEQTKTKGQICLINCFMEMFSKIRVFPEEIFSDEFNGKINILDSMLASYKENNDESFEQIKDAFFKFAEKYDVYYKVTIRKYIASEKNKNKI